MLKTLFSIEVECSLPQPKAFHMPWKTIVADMGKRSLHLNLHAETDPSEVKVLIRRLLELRTLFVRMAYLEGGWQKQGREGYENILVAVQDSTSLTQRRFSHFAGNPNSLCPLS